MKVLVIGAKGMLGTDLMNSLKGKYQVEGLDLPEIDITNLDQTIQTIEKIKPDVVINSAAYTDVDGCESNVDKAYLVNGIGIRNIAVGCQRINAAMVQVSTDYVFDGNSNKPYIEFDMTNPMSIYGKSKLTGEYYVSSLLNKFYIVRTSWLFGLNGKNFVQTMLNFAKERDELTIVHDQVGSPTYTPDLADAISELIEEPIYGIYHLTNSGTCSWFKFTEDIFNIAGITNVKVTPITTEQFKRPAPRPAYSIMDNYCWRLQGKKPLRHYKEAVKDYINNVK